MRTFNEPKIKEEVECDLCKTKIADIQLQDLDWSEARIHFDEPFVKCPICGNEIFDILKEKQDE